MSNPWSGKVAKSIASVRRPRSFWNVFFGVVIGVVLVGTTVLMLQILTDYVKYDAEQIFVEYKDGYLVTNTDTFKIPSVDKQEIKIDKLKGSVAEGERIILTISKLSNELLEAKYNEKVVYKKTITPLVPALVGWLIVVFPMLVLCVFMLIITNIKKPGKRIERIQRKFILKIHK